MTYLFAMIVALFSHSAQPDTLVRPMGNNPIYVAAPTVLVRPTG